MKAARDRWYENNKEYARWSSILRQYGMTKEQYESLLIQQGGVCAVCGKGPRGNSRNGLSLVVDHNHQTGAVRGLLCSVCNKVLGLFEEDEILLENAIQYLRRHRDASCEGKE